MIVRIVKMTINDRDIPIFLKIFNDSRTEIGQFDGIQYLELLKSSGDESVYFTISKWQDEGCLERYRQSDFFIETWQKVKKYFKDKPEAWSLGSIESTGTWH
jgi:heme-degrading monooxygenase HmoA